jgi:hypothetical protein
MEEEMQVAQAVVEAAILRTLMIGIAINKKYECI